MKKIFILVLGVCLFNTTFASQEHIVKTLNSKKIDVIKVIIDSKTQLKTSLSFEGESLDSLVAKVGGVSGVNGAYFCPKDYSSCGGINYTDRARIYDFEQTNRLFSNNGMFGFDKDNKAVFAFNGQYSGIENEKEIKYGLANYPVLLLNGENILYQSQDLLDTKMLTSGTKSFICSLEDQKTVYMGSIGNLRVDEMPEYLKNNLGCYNALNLDSGGSLSMVYNHQTIKKAGRQIMDAFVVVEYDFDTKNVELFLEKIFIKIQKLSSNKQLITNIYKTMLDLKSQNRINSKNYYIADRILQYLEQNKFIVIKNI